MRIETQGKTLQLLFDLLSVENGLDESSNVRDERGLPILEELGQFRHRVMQTKRRGIQRVKVDKLIGSEGEIASGIFVCVVGSGLARNKHVEGIVAAAQKDTNQGPI